MSNCHIVFTATVVNDLSFVDATFATDRDMTIVIKDGERVLGVPTANVIAVEKLPPRVAKAPPVEEQPVPADVQKD